MDLIPESIKGRNTLALDTTFLERLLNLGVGQLAIDFSNETDMTKLSLWLEQFGVPRELLPDDLDTFTLRDLMPVVVKIYNLSGTESSMQLLAEALGADKARIVRDTFVLDHDQQAFYNAVYRYDAGLEYRSFSIDVKCQGVKQNERMAYESSLRKLFKLFEPVHLFLRKVIFE